MALAVYSFLIIDELEYGFLFGRTDLKQYSTLFK